MADQTVNLLMVEDDLMLCEGWAEIFDYFGYQSKFYHNANELFLDMDSISKCNMLISDYYLPDLNGIEITEKLRKIRPDLPVILLTGSREPAIVDGVAQIARSLLLFKPVDMDELARAIDKMLLFERR